MSNAKPLVLAFSESQLKAPVQERINAVQSVQLYLNRAGVKPSGDLSPFLTSLFYCLADTKRALSKEGEVQISSCPKGLQEFEYITSGEVTKVALTKRQRDFVQDLGFQTIDGSDPQAQRVPSRTRAYRGLSYAANKENQSGCRFD